MLLEPCARHGAVLLDEEEFREPVDVLICEIADIESGGSGAGRGTHGCCYCVYGFLEKSVERGLLDSSGKDVDGIDLEICDLFHSFFGIVWGCFGGKGDEQCFEQSQQFLCH